MGRGNRGKKNGMWKGGRSLASNGYVLIRVGNDHHLADVRGYAYEHRLVAEKMLGRRLEPGEMVHHINENKADNSPDNLAVVANSAEHRFLHRDGDSKLRAPGEDNPIVECRCGCGGKFPKYDCGGRPREYISGHNYHPSPTIDGIVNLLQRGPLHRMDIAESLGKSLHAVVSALSKMKAKGIVTQERRGVWRINNG